MAKFRRDYTIGDIADAKLTAQLKAELDQLAAEGIIAGKTTLRVTCDMPDRRTLGDVEPHELAASKS